MAINTSVGPVPRNSYRPTQKEQIRCTIQYNTILYSTIQYNTVQYSTLQWKCRRNKEIRGLHRCIVYYKQFEKGCVVILLQ